VNVGCAGDQRILLGASQLLDHVLARERLPDRSKRFLIHQPHGTSARRVLRAAAAVVRLFARERVARIPGVERAVRAPDDVDEVHASIVTGRLRRARGGALQPAGNNGGMDESNRPAHRSGTFRVGADLTIHRLGFGAMRLTGPGIWGEPRDRGEAIRVLRRAVELGVDFIDTADSYGPEVSERLIAEALHPYPAGLLIATKAGFERPGPDEWRVNSRPAHLRASCEASLRRLRLERIDLFQLHRIDPAVPADDQLGTLRELQAEGKIKHVGLSEVSVSQIAHARSIVPIVSVQNRYSVTDRSHEAVVDYCEREGLGFIPWYPLAAGSLTAPGGLLARIAERHGASTAQVAIAWLLARSPVMLPIPGTSRVGHLEENVAAAAVTLDRDEVRKLTARSRSGAWLKRLVRR
jgi:pyridoxine 4-dehydrogenase